MIGKTTSLKNDQYTMLLCFRAAVKGYKPTTEKVYFTSDIRCALSTSPFWKIKVLHLLWYSRGGFKIMFFIRKADICSDFFHLKICVSHTCTRISTILSALSFRHKSYRPDLTRDERHSRIWKTTRYEPPSIHTIRGFMDLRVSTTNSKRHKAERGWKGATLCFRG